MRSVSSSEWAACQTSALRLTLLCRYRTFLPYDVALAARLVLARRFTRPALPGGTSVEVKVTKPEDRLPTSPLHNALAEWETEEGERHPITDRDRRVLEALYTYGLMSYPSRSFALFGTSQSFNVGFAALSFEPSTRHFFC